MKNYQEIADALFESEKNFSPIEQISKRYEDLDIDDAYKIQEINIKKKLDAGDKVTGKKIGLTSKAMQDLMGVDTPDYGFLLESMDAKDGVVPKNFVLQPKVEGELAFILKKELSKNPTFDDVVEATDYVVPAIEVVGSRIKDWKLTIVDTVSDNASCGMYVLSDRKIFMDDTDLTKIGMKLYKNGEFINEGTGEAVLGNPVNAVVWLAKCMGKYGVTLNAGDVILAGAMSAAVPSESGDEFCFDFGEFGELKVRFE